MTEVQSRKKKIAAGVILLVVVAGGIAVVRQCKKTAETVPEYVFSYAENQTTDYPTTMGANRFAELVEERTDGRIKILVYAEGQMGKESDVIKQMQYGGIDFARVSLTQLAEIIPELNVLQMPYLYNDSEHMWRVLDGDIGAAFLSDVQEYELVGLSWYDAGARNFYNSSHPITSLEDMKGMRIRVQESELMADMVEALGAIPVKVSYEEVYSYLERGEADGAENNWPSYEAMKHYEVAKYYTVDEHTRVPEMQIVSARVWEQLSQEDQEIIRQCAEESALYEREEWILREEHSREEAIAHGTEVVELSAEEKKRFQAAMTEIYEQYCGEYMDIIDEIIAEGDSQ